jgi:alanyl-tRNA synthetase
MTERIYYSDAYCREFDAVVTRVDQRGERLAVRLDRSAFYPTSGGQPFDTGQLASANVVEVLDEEGDVVHMLERQAPVALGQSVHGRIDWARRFDHMQQHTGQHILSAAFVRTLDAQTVSFHLGAELSTIDLAREVTAAEIASAERVANAVVWESRPVTVSYADATEAASFGLRKASARSGTLRLIEVDGFDLSACGGSHVKTTGEIGMIVVTGSERFKGGSRLEFACGQRALRAFQGLRDSVAASSKLLSTGPHELAAGVARLQGELREQARVLGAANEELASFRADRLGAAAESLGSARAVFAVVAGDAQALRALALSIARQPGMFVALVSGGESPLVAVARSRDVLLPCDVIVREVVAAFGGRGGGKGDMAQAGGLNGSSTEILAAMRAAATRLSP